MKYLKLFEDFNEFDETDNQFQSRIGDDIEPNDINIEEEDIDPIETDSECQECNCQCDSCVCTSDRCQCTNCNCINNIGEEEFDDEEIINGETEQDATHLSNFNDFNESKMNAGFKAYLDKKKSKSKKDDKKSDKDDKKDTKKKGLTAGQKKLPEAMQKAILKKQGK